MNNHERSGSRTDTRAGHCHRKIVTKAGEAEPKIPKLGKLPFETAFIERYERREESVEEALIETSLAGVSVRRSEDIPVRCRTSTFAASRAEIKVDGAFCPVLFSSSPYPTSMPVSFRAAAMRLSISIHSDSISVASSTVMAGKTAQRLASSSEKYPSCSADTSTIV